MIPILTVSHIAMTSSSFLIVAASFERYCATLNSPYLRFAQKYVWKKKSWNLKKNMQILEIDHSLRYVQYFLELWAKGPFPLSLR